MDRLAEQHSAGGKAPWPGFEGVSIQRLAAGFGCPAERVETYGAVIDVLDEVVPTLGGRTTPLVLEVAVVPEATFQPLSRDGDAVLTPIVGVAA